MKNWSAAAIAALLPAGCNSQEKGGNGAAARNGANAAGNAAGAQAGEPNPAAPPAVGDPNAQSIQPGEWEMTSVMTSLEGRVRRRRGPADAQPAEPAADPAQCITRTKRPMWRAI